MSDTTPPPVDNDTFARVIAPVSLEERMKSSYLSYAMSVIVGRALPDVRDGLKPVHRRTLYAMHEANNDWNKPFKKSARIVGDVLGKYHPHSQDAVYDALVRMAQDFSQRCILVDGQGNFGSIDGDKPAAMRYTEVRMARISHSLLDDLDKDTVDFQPNYDGAEQEPVVLPARFPNLLVNGAAGIAVGMATNIPPHNLGETIDACLLLLKKPDTEVKELMQLIPAPDFPTGAFILGTAGIRDAYQSGRGRVIMRARTRIEELKSKKQAIIVDELPYQVNKASLVKHIADLVRDKRLDGISDLRDESDRTGIRVVIELRRGENAEVIRNNLYKETQLQESFSVNIVAISDGAPRQMGLRDMLSLFLSHRHDVVFRRTKFELSKARARAHLLEGFAAAIANVDQIVELIKSSDSPAAAERALCDIAWPAQTVADMLARLEAPALVRSDDMTDGGLETAGGTPVYRFSQVQAKAILDMRLARLTAMERDKINSDYADIVEKIVRLLEILGDPDKIRAVVASELSEIKKQFADPRRSEIIDDDGDIDNEDLIVREPTMVTISHRGYVKRQAVTDYRTQRRGGLGKQAAPAREDDFANHLFVASTHDYLLVLTSHGRAYWIKVHALPLATRISRGKYIANFLELEKDEAVQAVLPLENFDGDRYVVMATQKGTIKKTPLGNFSRPRRSGIIAVALDEGDSLVNAALTESEHSIVLISNVGKAMRFSESNLRSTGRGARGVRGMKLNTDKGDRIVAMLTCSSQEEKNIAVLVATENGYGKRTSIGDFPVRGRGGSGIMAMRITNKTGELIAAVSAKQEDELMLITNSGVLMRTKISAIRTIGRATQGVRLNRMSGEDKLIGIARIAGDDADSSDDD